MEDFLKKGLYNLHLNIKILLLIIDETGLVAKQSNTSIVGINESKLDPSKQWGRHWRLWSSKNGPFK